MNKQDYIKMKLKTAKDYESDYHTEMIELIADRSPLSDLVDQIRIEQTTAIENYLKLRIRKKPLWLPNFLWKFVLSKLVYLQYFNSRNQL